MPCTTRCQRLGLLPEPLGDMPGLDFEGRALVLGGARGMEVTDRILSIDCASGNCEEVGRLPYKSRGHQVVRISDAIYVLGGFDGQTRNDCWRLEPASLHAVQLSPMPSALAWFAATVRDDHIVIIGGYSIPEGYLADCFEYSPAEDKWTTFDNVFDPLVFPKECLGSNVVCCYGGRVFSFGGADEFDSDTKQSNSLSVAAAYDARSQTWTGLDLSMPARADHSCCQAGSKLYIAGGVSSGHRLLAAVDEVDLESLTCRQIARTREGKAAPAVALVENRLVIAGGVTEPIFGMTDTIDVHVLSS